MGAAAHATGKAAPPAPYFQARLTRVWAGVVST
jgi:hypothetical protein